MLRINQAPFGACVERSIKNFLFNNTWWFSEENGKKDNS